MPALAAAVAVAASVALGPTGPVAAQAVPKPRPELTRPGQEPRVFERGEILVQFQPGTPGQAVAEAHRRGGGRSREALAEIDVHIVEVPPGQERARVAAYRANPNVRFSEVNASYHALGYAPPDDARVGTQWQYRNTGSNYPVPAIGVVGADIRAFNAWTVNPGKATVAIAILDSGIDQRHEDLGIGPKVTKQMKYAASSTQDDLYGHGTHVAGSAAAATNNGRGVAGTCPNCALYNVKVLGDTGSGSYSSIANGITWAAKNGAKVITMSFGDYVKSSTVEAAVNYAWGKGVVLTAAAGNGDEHGEGQNWGFYPAAYDNVIAVAATNQSDQKTRFSNWGANWVDVAAPGQDILSTAPTRSTQLWGATMMYGTISGTSMAAPHVAGIAGLVWSTGQCATNACVRGRIEGRADAIPGTDPSGAWGSAWSKGRVNACRAVTDATGAC